MTANAVDCGHDFMAGRAQYRGNAGATRDELHFDLTQWRAELKHVAERL